MEMTEIICFFGLNSALPCSDSLILYMLSQYNEISKQTKKNLGKFNPC